MAQLFLARHMNRVRTLLLTNCDVDENNPPRPFEPMIAAAAKGTLADAFLRPEVIAEEALKPWGISPVPGRLL